MIPEDLTYLLEQPGFAHVATIGPNGEPQSNPVWFIWDGTHLLFSQEGGRQKVKNLRRDPRIALSIMDFDNPQKYLEIRGEVVAFDPDEDYTFVHSLAKRYLGLEEYPYLQPGEQRFIVRVEPHHTTRMG
jgi:hypothetical protein